MPSDNSIENLGNKRFKFHPKDAKSFYFQTHHHEKKLIYIDERDDFQRPLDEAEIKILFLASKSDGQIHWSKDKVEFIK